MPATINIYKFVPSDNTLVDFLWNGSPYTRSPHTVLGLPGSSVSWSLANKIKQSVPVSSRARQSIEVHDWVQDTGRLLLKQKSRKSLVADLLWVAGLGQLLDQRSHHSPTLQVPVNIHKAGLGQEVTTHARKPVDCGWNGNPITRLPHKSPGLFGSVKCWTEGPIHP